MSTANKGKLAKKLLNITKSIDKVVKSGSNDFQNYQYLTLADVLEAVRNKMIEEEVMLLTSIENVNIAGDITYLDMLYTFVDTNTGEELSVKGSGSAKDIQGFGVPKALTIAQKIMLEKIFLIPTFDDPEKDHKNVSYTRNKNANKTTQTTTQNTKDSGNSTTNMNTKRSFKSLQNNTETTEKTETKEETKQEEAATPGKKEDEQPKRKTFGQRKFKTQTEEAKF